MVLSSSAALQSALLSEHQVRHGFFTRAGGTSPMPWGPLNFSTFTGDSPDRVAAAFAFAAAELGIAPSRLYVASQVHRSDIVSLLGSEDPAEVLQREADAVMSASPNVACGVRIADCAPILMVDLRSGRGAAVHAGWRGVVRGVVGATIAELRRQAAAPIELVAAVGPHIESCCFEVGEEVAAELADASDAGQAAVDRARERPHVDLRQVIEAQIRRAAGSGCAVDHVRGCTMCEPERFHSYRRDGLRGGRMLAAVVPPGSPR